MKFLPPSPRQHAATRLTFGENTIAEVVEGREDYTERLARVAKGRDNDARLLAYSRQRIAASRKLLAESAGGTAGRGLAGAPREDLDFLRQLAQATTDVLWTRDARSLRFEYASPAFAAMYGEPPSRGLEQWARLILPEDRHKVLRAFERVRGGERVRHEFRIGRPPDGAVRWVRDATFPLFGADGSVQAIGGVGHDVTEEKQAVGRLGVLAAEAEHRARNMVEVVLSVAERTAASTATVNGFLDAFQDRLAALARVQGLLPRPGEGSTFDALVRAELAALGAIDAEGRGARVVLDGPPGPRLGPGTAQAVALALHELATNAAKHGALSASAPEGRLRVRWHVEPTGASGRPVLHVDWEESGVTVPEPEAGTSRRRGYGRELIECALPYQFDAQTHYELGRDGVRCIVDLPLTEQHRGGERPRMATGGALAGRRLLLVEDEWLIAGDLARASGAAGAEVLGPVPSVGDALVLVGTAGRIDAAVLDVNLRGEMIFPVADALADRGVPFVFSTGYDASFIPARYAGVIRCEKPSDPARIARALFG
jgi:PAS domain S-box-containing protein